MRLQSPVLVKVKPVAALTIDVIAAPMSAVTEKWMLGCRSWSDDFDIH
jgi:hypothetical protein